ncbi:MAG: hypothetical protein DLM69_02775 [Candidatus Chloroheliales bacterium]|nr:MAG: hypothetical protein DLM69_02775 [Chloroflexota bacterium]
MNKAELLDDIRHEHERLEGLVGQLGEDQLTAPGVVGDWSVKDILAHITAWDRLLPGWLEAARIGAHPKLPSEGYSWADEDKLNEAIYKANKDAPPDKVMAGFQASYHRVLQEVGALSDEQLTEPQQYAWMHGKPLSSLVATDTSEHYKEFAEAIESWLDSQGGS